jgi:hypothetical protein
MVTGAITEETIRDYGMSERRIGDPIDPCGNYDIDCECEDLPYEPIDLRLLIQILLHLNISL